MGWKLTMGGEHMKMNNGRKWIEQKRICVRAGEGDKKDSGKGEEKKHVPKEQGWVDRKKETIDKQNKPEHK